MQRLLKMMRPANSFSTEGQFPWGCSEGQVASSEKANWSLQSLGCLPHAPLQCTDIFKKLHFVLITQSRNPGADRSRFLWARASCVLVGEEVWFQTLPLQVPVISSHEKWSWADTLCLSLSGRADLFQFPYDVLSVLCRMASEKHSLLKPWKLASQYAGSFNFQRLQSNQNNMGETASVGPMWYLAQPLLPQYKWWITS